MHFVEFSEILYRLHKTLNAPGVSSEQPAECVNELFLFLNTHQHYQFPERYLQQAIQIFQWYLEYLLPEEQYDEAALHIITEDYHVILGTLHKSSDRSRHIERRISLIIQRLRERDFSHEQEVIEALLHVAQDFSGDIPLPQHPSFRSFRKRIREGFKRNQVLSFFDRVFSVFHKEILHSSPALVQVLLNFQECCEDTLQTYFQGKAVLVDLTRQGFIMPMHVVVERDKTSEHVEYSRHDVDERMQSSSDTARTLACQYLQTTCGQVIEDTVRTSCRFSFPAVGYRDTSASLLLALQIVGNILDIEPPLATAVTGEVDSDGNVLRVGWVQEKISAVEADDTIDRFLIPAVNYSRLPADMTSGVTVVPVRSFPEAVEQYYGQSLQKTLKRYSRRQALKSITGLVTAPFLYSGVRNVFTRVKPPVTECDWRLLSSARDLYQQESHYQHAVVILSSILERFSREDTSTDALRIQAFALGQLGVIHLQQQHLQESLQAFRRAESFWKALHDDEHRADLLLRIGEVYRYSSLADGTSSNGRMGLQAYQQAHTLLKPSMPLYTRLHGKYHALTGYLHYWNGEYALAEQFGRQALRIFDEPESNWTYQTARQHLSRTLIRTGQHDEAYDILESTSQAAILQGPHDRARTALALSELSFAGEDYDKGMEYAAKVRQLCEDFSLQGQQRILQQTLQRYGVVEL